jgi:hypothetical protein
MFIFIYLFFFFLLDIRYQHHYIISLTGLQVMILFLFISHVQYTNLDVFYFQRTDRSIDAIRILKTDLNSS